MPVSKKPRAKAPPQPITAALVPDVATMDRYVVETPAHKRASALDKAQDLIYQAQEADSAQKMVKGCLRALAVSPLCADAYLMLAAEASTPKRSLALATLAMAAAERALGPEGFAEFAGEFWGWLETRPYMRARAEVAMAMLRLDRAEEAIGHMQAMLDLNPNDNQGIRYTLLAALLRQADFAAADGLLKRYDDEGSMQFWLTRALLAFRDGKDADARSYVTLTAAENAHVVPMLTGKLAPGGFDPGMTVVGSRGEASEYVLDFGAAWRKTEGAIAWLTQVAAEPPPES